MNTGYLSYTALRLFLDGMLGMMVLYALLSFVQQRKAIYWQYALYILCMIVTFRLDDQDYAQTQYAPGANYVVGLLEVVAFLLYIRFAIQLINIPRYDPFSGRVLHYIIILLIAGAGIDTVLWLAKAPDSLRSGLYTVNRFAVAALSLVVVPRIVRLRQPIISYFIIGTFFFVAGCIVALSVNYIPMLFTRQAGDPLTYPVTYMEIGVVLEVLCFTLGLARLNQQVEADKQQMQAQLIEQLRENERKQEKLQRIRDDIARDLHDELGADLGGIGMLALAASRQVRTRPDEVEDKLTLISQSARHVVATMREIIWNLNSAHDTIQNVASRLEETARTLLTQQAIDLHLKLPPPGIDGPLPAEYRRDLFLLFKEALHNLIRHSGGTEAIVSLTLTALTGDHSDAPASEIRLVVQDNGRGFDATAVMRGGNGLRSMKQRAAALGGELAIETRPGWGTRIIFTGRLSGVTASTEPMNEPVPLATTSSSYE